MRTEPRNEFDVTTREAITIQLALAPKIITENRLKSPPNLILGLDVSVNRNSEAVAAAVILSYPGLEVIEKAVLKSKVSFPYVPGLLSFREIPITLQICEKLNLQPDLVMVDGQGMAHPRRIGLASHLGLLLNIPTIGCAKSRLCGEYEEPEDAIGSFNFVRDKGDIIGAALRTRSGSKPLIISIGHQIDLPSAINWVLKCGKGYRLPEPTRMAHLASRGLI
ncbi:MAG TPA: deoxyribonuclease V [Dehalococcoidales bacterium]|jgi:deoxyribonuclease V